MHLSEYRRNPDLYNAITNGEWESAKRIFDQDKSALTEALTMYDETPLLIVAETVRETNFVKKFVELMKLEAPEALEHTDIYDMGALHLAARYGNKQAVVILAKECPNLVYATSKEAYDTKDWLPIHWAALGADKESVLHLLDIMYNDNSRVQKPLADISGAELLTKLIISEFYDVALDLLDHYPRLGNLQIESDHCALTQIAKKCSAFPSGSRLTYSWKRFIYYCKLISNDLLTCNSLVNKTYV